MTMVAAYIALDAKYGLNTARNRSASRIVSAQRHPNYIQLKIVLYCNTKNESKLLL